MPNDEDSINFQTRFERTEAEESTEDLPFAGENSTPCMQFTNFVLPTANAQRQSNQEKESQEFDDDQLSFDGSDSDDLNANTDAHNQSSSLDSSDAKSNSQSNEVSHPVSSSEILQTSEITSPSQQQGINMTVIKACRRLQTSRKQMANKYNRRTKTQVFQPGQIVTVKIPKIDRSTATCSRRCYAQIFHAKNNCYEMRTAYGILDRLYAAKNICVVPEALARHKTIPFSDKKVSLKEMARQECNTGKSSWSITYNSRRSIRLTKSGRSQISCRCKKFPCTKRCRCRKAGKKCSIYCHGKDKPCGNEAKGPAFNEYAVIDVSVANINAETSDQMIVDERVQVDRQFQALWVSLLESSVNTKPLSDKYLCRMFVDLTTRKCSQLYRQAEGRTTQ